RSCPIKFIQGRGLMFCGSVLFVFGVRNCTSKSGSFRRGLIFLGAFALGGFAGRGILQQRLINDGVASAIPVDVGTTGVMAWRDRVASGRARRGKRRAVRHDIVVFVISGMAVTEGDDSALLMPRGKARSVAMWRGQKKLIGVAQRIKGLFIGTVAN